MRKLSTALYPLRRRGTAAFLLLLSACGLTNRCGGPPALEATVIDALYQTPAQIEEGPLSVYHLGHSLVGQDMPAMLQQLAGAAGHSYDSQLGWGTFLKAHWDPDTPINGFETSNAHPRYRDAHAAVGSGEYDALVLTEAVEIRDSIKWMESAQMLHNWADKARTANPATRVYFYETWHNLDDPEGWLTRLDRDLDLYWEGEILHPALAYGDPPHPIYLIPAGQVMAALVRRVEAANGIGPMQDRHDLFDDTIHFNDLGAYLVALTHYAVIYQQNPRGLPFALQKADGTPARDPGAALAAVMQEVVWDVVTGLPKTGAALGR